MGSSSRSGGWRAGACALALALAGPSSALDAERRPDQYVHTAFVARDGLPQDFVGAIAQTPDGYLWLGSDEGLVRFDGAHFTTYVRHRVPGLPDNRIRAILPDGDRGLWVATTGHALVHLVGAELASQPVPAALADAPARALAAGAGPHELWVGLRDEGVALVRDGQLVRRWTVQDGLPSDRVESLLVEGANVWVGTAAGAAVLRGERVELAPGLLAAAEVSGIARDREGALWFGTMSSGLVRLAGAKITVLRQRDGLPGSEVRSVLVDNEGTLWAGTDGGLACIRGGRVLRSARPSPVTAPVVALHEDGEGGLWVGAEDGLHRLRDGDVLAVGRGDGVVGDLVFSVLQDRSGTVWLGTVAGLNAFKGDRAELVEGGRGTVVALLEDRRGALWIGTERGGVGRRENGRTTWVGPSSGRARKVEALAADSAGGVWIGTDDGLYDASGDVLVRADWIPSGTEVTAVIQDHEGTVWVASRNRGIYRRTLGGAVSAVTDGPPRSSAVHVFSIDARGALWAGTDGAGLWRWKDGRWVVLGRADGLFDDVVWSVLDDDLGNTWMASNRGIARVRTGALQARADGHGPPLSPVIYVEADGMASRECNAGSPSAWRTRDGRVWFGTTRGAAVLDPARLHMPRRPPDPLVEALVVDGREEHPPSAARLAPGVSRFAIRFNAVSLASPERLRFRTRLVGFDRDWVDAGAERQAHYTNLPPGSYRFEVQAQNGDAWGPTASLALTLAPRVYERLAVRVLMAALLAGALAGVPLLRIRRLRARERELEVTVRRALREVKVLSGLLPVCAWCRKIRDEHGAWTTLEQYVQDNTEAQVTHGMCPECFERVQAGEKIGDPGG